MVDAKFHHPYEPYGIQLELMRHIYDTIDNGYKVGIFESPTGTGKTLSLICSTMTWLRHYKKAHPTASHEDSDESSDDEPDWVVQKYHEVVAGASQHRLKEYEMHLDEAAKEYEKKQNKIHKIKEKKSRHRAEDSFVPDDYTSDTEISDKNELLKDEIKKLLEKLDHTKSDPDSELENPTKIFFSSRTHSQLNQFTHQLNLTSFEPSFDSIAERTKYLALGSRKQLCINSDANRFNDVQSINDACKEINKADEKCEYFKALSSKDVQSQFTDYSLVKIHDIEELASLGKHLKICPYYSVRNNLNVAEIVSLPYQMLLERNTRETLNIDLKDSVIIIDEAHNLFDAISNLNSVAISYEEIQRTISSLKIYLGKFTRRLNSGNRINILKLIKTCTVLAKFVENRLTEGSIRSGEEINTTEVFVGTTSDLFNIHKLEVYLRKSKLAFKLENYFDKTTEDKQANSTPILFKLTKFLKCLSNPSTEGQFFWDLTQPKNPSIKYMLLDPSQIFKTIVDECRCLILCGGTMEPISDYLDYLFPYMPNTSIATFSCNHIIPDTNLRVIPITGFDNMQFEFVFKNRSNVVLAETLGNCLTKLIANIPHGVVVFFPSYRLLDFVFTQWKACSIYQRLAELKNKVFVEPKSSSQVDEVLAQYADSVSTANGALLLSVVGGKLSEGINFSDKLARAVIMVGLPFPDLASGELIARRNYIEKAIISKGGSQAAATQASKQFVENICMKAVNQSIGRSIRHINDYSLIYLIDQRFAQSHIQSKLSGWIRRQLMNGLTFNQIIDETKEFFMSKLVTKNA